MAKNKKSPPPPGLRNPRRKPRTRRRVMGTSSLLQARQIAYAQLLHSPDSGVEVPGGVYDGEKGITQRFVTSVTLANGINQTAGFMAYCPSTGNYLAAGVGTTASVLSPAFTNSAAPGAAFLGLNAAKSRGIACKLEIIPSAVSVTNIVGEVCAGVTTSNTFPSGSYTIDTIFNAAKAYGPIQRKVYTSRWYPSGLDHTYNTYNSAPNEDHNLVFIAFRNWPATATLQVRVTYVVEYTMKPDLGIPPTGAVSTPVQHAAVIDQLHKSDPHWHHSILDDFKDAAKTVSKDASSFVKAAARHGLVSLGEEMVKVIPRALSLPVLM